MNPGALVGDLERDPRLPGGPGDRFSGYAVLGLPFASGHVLALRRFHASSLGTGYTTVWHRDPAGRWTFYSTAAPERSCARYFGGEVSRNVVTPIEVTWPTPWALRVAVGDVLDWSLTLGASLRTRWLNGLASILPEAAWRSPALLRAMAATAGAVLRAGRINLTGRTPNGHRFVASPRAIWWIARSRAQLDGRDLGPTAPLATQPALGDVWLPRRGLFAAVQVRMERPATERATAGLPAPARRTAGHDFETLGHGFGVGRAGKIDCHGTPPRQR